MNKLAKWLMAGAMTGIASAAIAQDTQFNIMGQFQGGGTLSGELMINTTTGSFDSASVTVAGLPNTNVSEAPDFPLFLATFDGTYVGAGSEPYLGVGTYEQLDGAPPTGALLTISEPVSSLVGYAGGPVVQSGLAFEIPVENTAHLLVGDETIISGSITAAPEIDPASAASGLTLLLGSLMVRRGRRSGVVAA